MMGLRIVNHKYEKIGLAGLALCSEAAGNTSVSLYGYGQKWSCV
jgi:hypothetical protein